MASATIAQPQKKVFGLKKWLLVAAGILLLVGFVTGFYLWYANVWNGLPAAVDLAEFEEISGFQPKMVVVTAGGGIVDLRYKVVDPLIVERVMANTQTAPRLLVADTGRVLDVGAHHTLNEYLKNATYFMFYPNAGGIVQTGTELWVIVEDVRYGPIVAK